MNIGPNDNCHLDSMPTNFEFINMSTLHLIFVDTAFNFEFGLWLKMLASAVFFFHPEIVHVGSNICYQ